MRAFALLSVILLAFAAPSGCDDPESRAPVGPQTFSVTISNLSDATATPSGYSPGLWVLHAEPDPFFVVNAAAPDGLEGLAEDGVPDDLAAALRDATIDQSIFGADGGDDYVTAPLHPGETLTFEITADPAVGPRLSFAMMVGETNDWFIATQGSGVPLFDEDGAALPSRDVTAMFAVWDAGTEADAPFGQGPDQAARQVVRGAGAPEDPAVIPEAGRVRAAQMPVAMNAMLRVEIVPQ